MKWIILPILILAAVLRLYQLNKIPPSLFADEASIGYNAYTIAKRGQDEYGIRWPIFFRAFGEYKGPVQIYSTAPFVKIMGLNELSVRLPSVIYGTLTVWAVFLLGRQIFSGHKHETEAGLLSALFLAVAPWHIHMSRISFEGLMPFVFFTTLGTYFYLKLLNDTKYIMPFVVCFVVALYSYFPARIFVPLYVFLLLPLSLRRMVASFKHFVIPVLVGLVLMIPLLQSFFTGSGLSRWKQVNIFNNPPKNQTVLAHIADNYLSHFSFEFLFTKGDIDMPGQFITRHSVRGSGELLLMQLPLIIFGALWMRNNKKGAWIILIWLLLYPLGSTFTQDTSAQATRSVIGVIPWQLLTAGGVVFIYNYLQKYRLSKLWIGLIVVLLIISVGKYQKLYWQDYSVYSADYWGWQYGQKQIVNYFITQSPYYDDLYSSGEANGAYIFFNFYDPTNFCLGKCRLGDIGTNPSLYNPERKQLFSVAADKMSQVKFTKVVHTVYYLSGKPAFYIGEI